VPKKILICDDEPHVRLALETRLKSQGYVVITAEDGGQGIEKAKSEAPDLILMDIMMPEVDGHEAIAALKKDEQTKDIPIIVLTARVEQKDYEKAQSKGVADYVTKPYNPVELIEKIKKELE